MKWGRRDGQFAPVEEKMTQTKAERAGSDSGHIGGPTPCHKQNEIREVEEVIHDSMVNFI